jgi:hypothetical protein
MNPYQPWGEGSSEIIVLPKSVECWGYGKGDLVEAIGTKSFPETWSLGKKVADQKHLDPPFLHSDLPPVPSIG